MTYSAVKLYSKEMRFPAGLIYREKYVEKIHSGLMSNFVTVPFGSCI
jgi:hypothetical protein